MAAGRVITEAQETRVMGWQGVSALFVFFSLVLKLLGLRHILDEFG